VPDSITVTGHGAATGTPDLVVLNAGAEVIDESPGRAFATVSEALSAMLIVVRSAGVDSADIQTKNASVRSHWYDESRARVRRFQASQQFTARLRDIDAAGETVGSVVAAGGEAARLHGMSLGFSDVAELTRSARTAAWEDARAKAEQYAQLADRTLGPVRRITAVAGSGFVALASPGSAQMDMEMAVEAGESEITATVEVEWALVD
jgi:hypothetical protein